LLLDGTVAGCTIAFGSGWSSTDHLTGFTASLLLFWIAGFALFFGSAAVKSGWFALAFLFLTVPMPDFLLGRVIYLLQKGSAEVAAALFDLTALPVLRDGFVFHLSRTNIEVATECSGIRSSLALLVLALLVAHFTLRTFWKKTVFVIAGLMMMVIKNGIRIVTLTLLANYVDPVFLHGWLHNAGGVIFFILGLLLLLPLLWLLQRGETSSVGLPRAVSSESV
jgi:exosortase